MQTAHFLYWGTCFSICLEAEPEKMTASLQHATKISDSDTYKKICQNVCPGDTLYVYRSLKITHILGGLALELTFNIYFGLCF